MEKFKPFLKKIEEEWLFPYLQKCSLCGDDIEDRLDYGLCSYCRAQLDFCPLYEEYFPLKDSAAALLAGRRSDFLYDRKGKDLIINYKFFFQPSLAEVFAQSIVNKKRHLWPESKNPGLAYVPATLQREKERGFDSTKHLAEKISEYSGLPLLDLLVKTKQPEDQHHLTLNERWQALENIYAYRPDAVKHDGDIIIVDDIYTTGATIHHCALALKQAGYKKIYSLCVAHTPRA